MYSERPEFREGEGTNRELGRFPHSEVELKWMKRWVEDGIYRAEDNSPKPKYFVLDMFPYPSGSGLHVGHVEGYTASDILSRYKRMRGFEVLHPMGWDAFGLPTENYAIQTGIDPHQVTARNAAVFREQCMRTGFSIDWDREIDTSRAEYYRVTQQIFLDLYKNDLAYKAKAPVNWCTDCQTVLANEQVIEGHCERCNTLVESRNIEQWYFRVTSYAGRLLRDLNRLDWPESTKNAQRNWIGETGGVEGSEGVEIQIGLDLSGGNLTLFTTEPESLAQPSYLAVAPEHPQLNDIVIESQRAAVAEYVSTRIPQSEVERKKLKEKTGVFTGNYAINPLTGERMEVWVADFVLMDESNGVRLEPLQEGKRHTWRQDRKSVLKQLQHKAVPSMRYKLRDWLVSRERYWGAPIPIVHCAKCGDQPVPEHELPVLLPQMGNFAPTGIPPLARSEKFLHTNCPHCHGPATRETKTLDTFVDSSWYFMRFADPHNRAGIGRRDLLRRWLPVDYYIGGADHSTGHLIYSRFITKVLYDLGNIDFDEPFLKLRHQGMILGQDGRKMSKRWGNIVNPLDVENEFGSDALRLYEMFMGPLEHSKAWNSNSIVGPRRFIDKVWQLQQMVRVDTSPEEMSNTNALIISVTDAIESGKFNTAVSDFMKYLNYIEQSGRIGEQSYETFLKLLAPFTPFITEEIWERTNNRYSIHQTAWPIPSAIERPSIVSIPVMIDGKVRGTIALPADSKMTKEDVLSQVKDDPNFSDLLEGSKIERIIYKPGQVFSIVR